ncbi:hypothetical protein ACIPPQ_14790 [Sphingopyxis sp. LARHCG72]
MTATYRWALFDDMGRCTSIISSPVDLDLPFAVGAEDRPDDLYLGGDNRLARRQPVELVASRRYLVADGVDRVTIAGLPADARVLVDGRAQSVAEGISSDQPGSIVVEAAPPFISAPVLIEVDTLSAIAARLAAEVDRQAETVRTARGLLLAGQQEAYAAKTAEARTLLAGGDGAACPFLQREAEARGVSLAELASAVIAKADAWAVLAAEIEALRAGAKQAIANATDIETIITAAAVDWPAPDQGESQ